MDGREGMALTGSSSFYLNRGGVSGPGSHSVSVAGGSVIPAGISTQTSYRPFSNPSIPVQSNVGGGIPGGITFQVENPSQSFSYGMNMSVPPSVPPGDQVKKKRGRPRKYGPNGANMSLGLSTMSSSMGSITPGGSPKIRGRPRGSGWKQRLAPLGDWMNKTAGLAFTPHVLHVRVGEDVAAKVLSFAQQRPRALCIMSASGAVSLVTLRQPTTSGGIVSYEGRFEILCLSGSYLVSETGGPRDRDGGLSISVCSPDGHCIGGAIGGRLIASTPVQVVVCSFVYDSKAKEKTETSDSKADNFDDKSSIPLIAVPFQKDAPHSSSSSRAVARPPVIRPELRYPHTELELKRE